MKVTGDNQHPDVLTGQVPIPKPDPEPEVSGNQDPDDDDDAEPTGSADA